MSLEGFTCQKCGEEYGHNFLVKRTYDIQFTKPSEEDEKKMIRVALVDNRYEKYIISESGQISLDHEKMAKNDRALAEELYLNSRYELELRDVETAYLRDETKFVGEYGTCPNCNAKGFLRESG
jgi:hypothetical protein